VDDACNDMAEGVFDHLYENFRDPSIRESAWDCLAESFRSNPQTSILWDRYHDLQIEFAKNNISVDKDAHLLQKIQSLQNIVKELERKLGERDSELSGKGDLVDVLLNSLLNEKHQFGDYSVSDLIVDLETAGG
jgi:hypothetical protein